MWQGTDYFDLKGTGGSPSGHRQCSGWAVCANRLGSVHIPPLYCFDPHPGQGVVDCWHC